MSSAQLAKKEAEKSPLILFLEKSVNMINSGLGRDKMCRVI